jgi:squalene-hopene/tetraprenyl-beta-curcumene cyclase
MIRVMDSIDPVALEETLANARRALLEARNEAGYWEGELSSSALSTATAIFALSLHPQWRDNPLVARGLEWLKATQNSDGGWGDTIKSLSNISTTALCWAAFMAAPEQDAYRETLRRADAWLTAKAGGIDPDHLIPAIIKRYGKDRTFSVPILTMCALAGRLGEGREAWRRVPQLPFELAACPQRWFQWLRLPVVSYALPALIAIGVVRHRHRPTRNPVTLAARRLARGRALRLLEEIQPSSGGYLEATPLTSFVVMSLIGAGLADHPVVHRGIEFLVRSARPDGSWPIDTNLATWVTTLAVNALAIDPDFHQLLPEPDRRKIRDWLLDQQYTTEHPYTLARPGGWAWTNLPGGVPDGDDTPGALLALKNLGLIDDRTRRAAAMGVQWLLDLQNRDGGVPTFCRGWGKLPFDRSSADLTAHALRAWAAWIGDERSAVQSSRKRAIEYLIRVQRKDGAWTPLWFGNQHAVEDDNPTYGTARVLHAIGFSDAPVEWSEAATRATEWVLSVQNDDGGWGGDRGTPSTIEETALAVEALALREELPIGSRDAIERGLEWMVARTESGTRFDRSPIGFYFAKLWYFEKLYPPIFTVGALNAVKRLQPARTAEAVHPA